MQPFHFPRNNLLKAICLVLLFGVTPHLFAQAALLLEQPYGVFGLVNPTGHAAIYLENVCADSPVHLRMCQPGETGIVISRYKGIAGYDWIAVPLIPYLYAVDDPAQVPAQADQETVNRLRDNYRESRLGDLGDNLPPGSFFNGGWTELVGTVYDRRTYAFRFATTREQDARLVALLNSLPNQSHFNILFKNCADFDRFILNNYFPHVFNRTVFPDAGITTPKRITYTLVKYAARHPEAGLSILEIPQIPGYRRASRPIHGVAETLITNGYVIPIVFLNPYIAGGVLADYLVRGRYRLVPKNPTQVQPDHLDALISPEIALPAVALTPAAAKPENSLNSPQTAIPTVNGETVIHLNQNPEEP